MNKPPSLIKWTGSKRLQSIEISKHFPQAKRYHEPFLGGGSVLFFATKHFDDCIASDIYTPLITLWSRVKNEPEIVIDTYRKEWKSLQQDFPKYYYKVRERFNEKQSEHDLLFLSRTCANGIIRFNNKGEFNNSLHVTRKGMNPNNFERIVIEWSKQLVNTTFLNTDYSELINNANKEDFFYLDPPYYNSKNRYMNNLKYDCFLDFLEKLNSKGSKWALSFDGTRGNEDLTVDIPKELYKHHYYLQTGNYAVKKVLSSKLEKVSESLYLNY